MVYFLHQRYHFSCSQALYVLFSSLCSSPLSLLEFYFYIVYIYIYIFYILINYVLGGRCKITTMDQDTGEVAGPEPLATLQRLRKYKEDAIFGQNVVHESAGYICVGDVVEVEVRSS